MNAQLLPLSQVLQSLSFGQPVVLWLLVVAVPLALLVPRTRLRRTRAALRVGIVTTRLAIVALLLVALAEPRLNPPGHSQAVVFAIDVSASVTPDQQQWARDWVDRATRLLPTGSHADTVEFAERAQLAGSAAGLNGASTDLSAALRMAAALLPRDPSQAPQIVLLTDGWPTAGGPAIDAVPSGITVSYVALPPPTPGQRAPAVVHSLDVPPVARAGDRIDINVDLQAAKSVDAQLRVWLDQAVIIDGPIHLEPGDTHLALPQRIPAPGFLDARAELQVADLTSRLDSIVVAKPPGRVLVLEDEANQADGLAASLVAQGLQVERRPASRVPPSAAPLSDFDGAVLVNTPATGLTLDQQRTLVSFVQDLGRGLVIVGGQRAYSPGGYQDTVLDDVSPVSAEPPLEPQQGSLALFLVIDRSGSMDILTGGGSNSGGATKMAMAREAAIEAAGLLQPQDTLGVIAFDSAFQWVVSPMKLRGPNDVKLAQTQIRSIRAGGGTSILPPLEAAFQAAAQSDAPLKHIILLTDGESSDRGYEDLIARMQPAHVTLSTLAIGSDADTRLLSNLAHVGGGRYYFTERSTQIPRIASKETTILTRNAIVDGRVAAVVAEPSPILRGIGGDLPPLNGYVATTRKARAVTALETERGHPLLAHWQYGLGRVVAWTSDAQQGWASSWSTWPDAAAFWAQAVRWSLPAPIRADFQPAVQVAADGRQVTLSVQALRDDGQFADLQDTRATVLSPDGTARELSLPQRGPGSYALDFRVATAGAYRVLFKQGAREEVLSFTAPDNAELHSAGTNAALLENLARTSGGHVLTDPQSALRASNGAGPPLAMWPWALLLALLLLPLDVALRRRA